MHVKKGDTVQVIAGKDKGKVGEITKVPITYSCFGSLDMVHK